MADRADALGGSVDIRSAPGSGTTIVIELPL
jgi:signal transduction histidine kinase